MIIKKYIVKDLEEAQGLISRDLGPHGMVLTSRQIRYKAFKALFFADKFEVIAAADEDGEGIHALEQGLIDSFGYLLDNQPEIAKAYATDDEALQNRIQGKLFSMEKNDEPAFHLRISNYLISIGILPMIAGRIEKALRSSFPENSEEEHYLQQLKREVARLIMVAGPICLSRGRTKRVALAGAPGSGKTTACIQIAVQYVGELGKKAAIISMDTYTEHIKSLLDQFGIPFSLASTDAGWAEALEIYKDFDLVLIDTCGCSIHDCQRINTIADALGKVQDLQTHVVLNSAKKDLDLIGEVEQFSSCLKIESLIFTKLDQTVAKGCVVNVSQLTHKQISYCAFGPTDFILADPMQLAQTILEKNPLQRSAFIKDFVHAFAVL